MTKQSRSGSWLLATMICTCFFACGGTGCRLCPRPWTACPANVRVVQLLPQVWCCNDPAYHPNGRCGLHSMSSRRPTHWVDGTHRPWKWGHAAGQSRCCYPHCMTKLSSWNVSQHLALLAAECIAACPSCRAVRNYCRNLAPLLRHHALKCCLLLACVLGCLLTV